jgi:hypothetical protein
MTGQISLFDQRSEPKTADHPVEQALASIPINKDVGGGSLVDLLPDDALLSLNRGYPIRASHVSRLLRAAQERRAEKEPIKRDDLAVELSISRARVEGSTNMMRKAELLQPKNAPTPLGSLVLAHSPHFDDAGLLWFLHYLLASNPYLVLWSHLFNQALVGREEITIADVTVQYTLLTGRWSKRTLDYKASKELGAIIRTYSDEMFSPLGLLGRRDIGAYDAPRDAGVIPPLVWLACLLAYRDRYYPGAASLETPLIVDAHFSPGRILRQREATVRRALDELHNANLLAVETRSGLDQVRFRREITWLSAVRRYCEEKGAQ